MDSLTHATYAFVLIFGSIVIMPFMISTLYSTLKKGVIERKPPHPPFTRQNTPKAFWATIIYVTIGLIGMVWGMGVMLYRLLHP